MTKPEGYEGHYADAATEIDEKRKKMRAEFEAWWKSACDNPDFGGRGEWMAWQAAIASVQEEVEKYTLIGYIQHGAIPIDPRGADTIYMVSEEGFDGCTVPVYVRAERAQHQPVEPEEVYSPFTVVINKGE